MRQPVLPVRGKILLVAAALLATTSLARANPQGGTVRAGSATIAVAPGRTDINQTSDRAIIDWRGFSIGAGELTRFNQPSSTAATLNRVTGGDPSQILGQLSANGRILLINPNGVLFGAGSRVDIAGLIATTANLSNDDFMARRLNFALPSGQPTASVVNRGTITVKDGGLVALVAPGVSNEGTIQARLGRVSLVAADRFTVDFHGDQLIRFALDDKVARAVVAPDGVPLTAAVSNAGRIVAEGGTVQMSANVARGVLDRVIDMSGVVEARAARQVGGTIVLDGGAAGTVAVAGRLDASGRGAGQTGGRVEILGQHVGLFAGTNVDAAGAAGGGTVLVGGNTRGQGPQRNAAATYVDAQASIKADAITKGDGGTVVVWSDSYTRFDGTISARGGASGGNGGQVETSSHDVLNVGSGRVYASAPVGKPGLWLLDPSNATISSGAAGTDSGVTATGGPPADVFTATANNATIVDGSINAALNAGENVTITNSGPPGNGNIKFDNSGVAISENSGSALTLTLSAGGSISIQGGGTAPKITATGAGSLSLSFTAGGAVAIPQSSLNGGSITTTGAGAVTQNGAISAGTGSFNAGAGTITLSTAGNKFTGAVSLSNTGANNVALSNSGGALVLGTSSVGTGTLAIAAGGAITQNGTITQAAGAGAATFTAGANAITLTQSNSLTGAVVLSNSGVNNVALTNAGALSLGASTVGGGTLAVTAGGAITQTGVFTQAAGAGATTFNAGANAITLTQANLFTGAVSLNNSGANNVALTNGAQALALGTSSVGTGTLAVTAGGAITQTSAVTQAAGAGTATFIAGANAITLTQSNSLTGAVSLNNSGANNVQLTNSPATVLGTSVIGQNLTVISGGSISQAGALTVSGTTTLSSTAAGSDILLNTQANSLAGAVGVGGTVSNIRDVALRNVNAGATVPTLGGLTGLRNLTLQFDSAGMALGALAASGNLVATAGGAITQTAAATVGGTSSFTAGANPITLTQANGFAGAVSLSNSGANDVQLTNSVATTLGTSGIGGNLTIASGGGIGQTGALTVGGATTLSSTAANADIALGGQANNLGGAVSFSGTLANIRDVALRNVNGASGLAALGGLANLRNLTLQFDTGAMTLSAFNATGNVVATAGGAMTLTGLATVTGSTTLSAPTIAIQAGLTAGATTLSGAITATGLQVGGLTVSGVSASMTGTVGGATGSGAAARTSGPVDASHLMNGCELTIGCPVVPTPVSPPSPSSPVTPTTVVTVTTTANQVVSVINQSPPPQDPNGSSSQHGFEVAIPTQNVDWSDPMGDLRVKLAPEFDPLKPFFYGGQASH